MRLLFTFPSLHQVLAAEKALRLSAQQHLRCRPTPTPPGLSQSICGMSVELLDVNAEKEALDFLAKQNINPSGSHLLPD